MDNNNSTVIPINNTPAADDSSPQVARKSFQLRALGRQKVSYQSRQWFTNICCVSVCPLMMVIISSVLGIVVKGLLENQIVVDEFVYCSKLNGMDQLNMPIYNAADPRLQHTGPDGIGGATRNNITHTNFLPPDGITSAALSSLGVNNNPCVRWFGKQYPYSEPYERDPKILPGFFFDLDSTFIPQPSGGWLNPTNFAKSILPLSSYQLKMNYLYSFDSSIDSKSVGTLEDNGVFTDFTKLPASFSINPPYFPANSTNGLLGTIENRIWLNVDRTQLLNARPNTTVAFQAKVVPWYNKTDGSTERAIDDILGKTIRRVLDNLSTINKTAVSSLTAVSQEDYLNFLSSVADVLQELPYGGVFFRAIDHVAKKYGITFSIGSDGRISQSSGFPRAGIRQLAALTELDNAILRSGNASLANATITQGLRAFPKFANTAVVFPISSVIGSILYPFGISFLIPIFTIMLVKEKEDRILIMMKMNGLKTSTYYLAHYAHWYLLHILSSAVFIIAGYVANQDYFRRTSMVLIIVQFFFWGHAQTALAFLFSSIFSKSRTALVVSFLLVLLSVIISMAFPTLFPNGVPAAFFLWPPFAFYRILSLTNNAAISTRDRPYTLGILLDRGREHNNALVVMIIATVLFLLLASYLQVVVPSEFGVAKPWHFPVSSTYKRLTKKKSKKGEWSGKIVEPDFAELEGEDEDVKTERARVLAPEFNEDSFPLVMKTMRKEFGGRKIGKKIAVKNVTLAVEKGIVAGLLGPNGAGKTTLINILTGLFEPTAGQAKIGGFDIVSERDDVYRVIGVCPQHDILWDDLSVGEHLLFYSRLKGIDRKDEKRVVDEALTTVALLDYYGRLSKNLSGGERRRLCIAIALVGNPSVVFLDEPTTGLDPEVRRLIWNIVNEAKKDKTIVLTTHSMEEAEVLCSTIGIMAKGGLRCLGPQLRLKQLYGSGFKIFFISEESATANACKYIESLLPEGWQKIDAFATNTSYEFNPSPGIISKLFYEVEKNKANYGILDWGLSQTTLEEVFLRIIAEADAEAD
ncbi:hypothetical protein HK098_003018 [Nowakowskiella sp. JEL0407]|nr:hypothetical protein HK098_003018 [Nowakowskiella sp. JEL0407]